MVGGEDKIFNLSSNEKSGVISTTKMTQFWKQKFYRYKNENNEDDYDDKKWMATENGVYNTTCSMHEYYTKNLHITSKLLNSTLLY
jgi:regulation of enolase protein 1 (concanavalin A-like superfamily)